MKKHFMGIDPGKTGALAVISGNGHVKIFDFIDPLVDDYLLSIKKDNNLAIIEKVGAMPKQGRTSIFSFGTNYGIWQGLLRMAKIPFLFCTPAKWQKGMYDSVEREYKSVNVPLYALNDDGNTVKTGGTEVVQKVNTKAMSLNLAKRLFPSIASKYLTRKKDHNRAEALLIAEYCRRKFNNTK